MLYAYHSLTFILHVFFLYSLVYYYCACLNLLEEEEDKCKKLLKQHGMWPLCEYYYCVPLSPSAVSQAYLAWHDGYIAAAYGRTGQEERRAILRWQRLYANLAKKSKSKRHAPQ